MSGELTDELPPGKNLVCRLGARIEEYKEIVAALRTQLADSEELWREKSATIDDLRGQLAESREKREAAESNLERFMKVMEQTEETQATLAIMAEQDTAEKLQEMKQRAEVAEEFRKTVDEYRGKLAITCIRLKAEKLLAEQHAEAAEADYATLQEVIKKELAPCMTLTNKTHKEWNHLLSEAAASILFFMKENPHPGADRMKRLVEALEQAYDDLCTWDAQEAEGAGGDNELIANAQNVLFEAIAALTGGKGE